MNTIIRRTLSIFDKPQDPADHSHGFGQRTPALNVKHWLTNRRSHEKCWTSNHFLLLLFHHNFLRLGGTLIQTHFRLIPEVITTKKQRTMKPLVRLNQLRCWKTSGQEVSRVIFTSYMMPLRRCCKRLNLCHTISHKGLPPMRITLDPC